MPSSADAAVETASWAPFRANDLDTWARIATSDLYQLFSLTQVVGMVFLLFGLFALYARLAGGRSPRLALAGLVLGVVSIVPVFMMLGELSQAQPILATFYQNGINVCPSSLAEPGFVSRWGILSEAFCKWWWGPASFPIAFPMNFLLWPGTALTLAFAIARSGLVSKWAALPFGLAYYLCILINPPYTLVGGFLMVGVGAWIALQLNRASVSPATPSDTTSADFEAVIRSNRIILIWGRRVRRPARADPVLGIPEIARVRASGQRFQCCGSSRNQQWATR